MDGATTSIWTHAFDRFATVSDAAPNVVLAIAVVLTVAASIWVLLYRPAPWLGAVMGGTDGADADLSKGTPFWASRPLGERARLAARSIGAAVLRCVPLFLAVALAWMTVVHQSSACLSDSVAPGSWSCGTTTTALLAANAVIFLPLIVLALTRRFWAMGRSARLKVIESSGAIGLHPWWIAELGLRAGSKLTLKRRRGLGKSKAIDVRTDLDRGTIAVPPDVRATLDLALGEGDLVLFPRQVPPIWPVLPIAISANAFFGAWFSPVGEPMNEPVAEDAAGIELPVFQKCLSAFDTQRIQASCAPLLGQPLDPKDKAVVYLQMAAVSNVMGDAEGARTAYDTALALDPKSWRAHKGRAQLAIAVRDYDTALSELAAAIDLAPSVALLKQRGTVLDWAARSAESVDAYSAALDLGMPPERGALYLERAVTYSNLGDQRAALRDIARAKLYGGYDASEANFLAGRAQYLGGNVTEAINQLELAMSGDSGDPYPALWLYLARMRAGVEGVRSLRRIAAGLEQESWPATLIAVVLGDIAPGDVTPGSYPADDAAQLEDVQDKAQACEMNFYLGEVALIKGETGQATAYFEAAVKTGISEYTEYGASRLELARMSGGGEATGAIAP